MSIRIDGTNTAANPGITGADADTGLQFGTDEVNIVTGGTARATVDSSGRVLVGTSTSRSSFFNGAAPAQFQTEIAASAGLVNASFVNNGGGAGVIIGRSNGSSVGSNTIVSNGDSVGFIDFQAADGTNFEIAARIEAAIDSTPGNNDMPGRLVLYTTADAQSNPTERMRIDSNGRLFVPGVWNFSTSGGTTVVVTSDNQIRKAASSIRYKTDVEDLEDAYADQILNIRPVWYRSLCDGDDPNHGYWGFIAEEVAEIDPRLTTWKFHDISYDENGSRVVTKLDTPEPEGVAYDRFVPHLLNLIKRQKEQLETQAATIAALDARLTALEGGTNP